MSLKYLFGITAFCAVIAWCASQYGYRSPTFWLALVFSVILSGLFVLLARSENFKAFAFLVCLPFFALCVIPLFSYALIIHFFLLFATSIIVARNETFATKSLCTIAFILCATSQVLGILPGRRDMQVIREMRAAFPLVSLESRLAYEEQSVENMAPLSGQLTIRVNSALDEREQYNSSTRASRLRQIHSQRYEQFIRANGFGVTRMPPPSMENLTLSLETISFDRALVSEKEREYTGWSAIYGDRDGTRINDMHEESQNDFLDTSGFGAYFEKENKVAGFVEHGFHFSPKELMENPTRWKINRLELVSLLKFAEPQVYVLDHLPRMDQLKSDKVPTRALNEFELDALDQLWTDEDVVISQEMNNYQMLGSLRAAKKCLECHQVERGTLLGAFTYQIQHLPPEDTDKN